MYAIHPYCLFFTSWGRGILMFQLRSSYDSATVPRALSIVPSSNKFPYKKQQPRVIAIQAASIAQAAQVGASELLPLTSGCIGPRP